MCIKRPDISQKYIRKIKLLLTSNCPYTCPFCHNEGQFDTATTDVIDISVLQDYLPFLRRQFREITLSGGEPLFHIGFDKILDLLYLHGFDITLDTSGINIENNVDSLWKLKSLHVSILTLSENSKLNKYNGDFISKVKNLQLIKQRYPLLNITINVILHDHNEILNNLLAYIKLVENIADKIKFIYEFNFNDFKSLSDSTFWVDRWEKIHLKIQEYGFKYSSSNPREVEYLNYKNKVIELSEIPCVLQDQIYNDGKCFDNMDLVIDSKLMLKLCRWQNNHISIKELRNKSIESIVTALVKSDTISCPYNISKHPFIKSKQLEPYIYSRHYNWNTISEKSKILLQNLIECNEISYYGKEGFVSQFEKEFANYHNVSYALALSSGTMALYLAYRSIGIGSDSEVITSIYSYPGSITSLMAVGAKVVFCDADALSGNIDIVSLLEKISNKTKGVLVTHMWGNPANIELIAEICNGHNIKLIEDCSHAFGAEVSSRKVGTFGDIACFSLQANKSVVSGEGGIIITKKQEYFENAVAMSSLRKKMLDDIKISAIKRYWETGISLKFKIHPLGAAIALGYLRELDSINTLREMNHKILLNILCNTDGIDFTPEVNSNSKRVFYTFKPILNDALIPYRDQVVSSLILKSLEAKSPDNQPLNYFPFYKDFLQKNQKSNVYPNAEKYYNRVISIPSFTYEPKELVEYYGNTINEIIELFLKKLKNTKL